MLPGNNLFSSRIIKSKALSIHVWMYMAQHLILLFCLVQWPTWSSCWTSGIHFHLNKQVCQLTNSTRFSNPHMTVVIYQASLIWYFTRQFAVNKTMIIYIAILKNYCLLLLLLHMVKKKFLQNNIHWLVALRQPE